MMQAIFLFSDIEMGVNINKGKIYFADALMKSRYQWIGNIMTAAKSNYAFILFDKIRNGIICFGMNFFQRITGNISEIGNFQILKRTLRSKWSKLCKLLPNFI